MEHKPWSPFYSPGNWDSKKSLRLGIRKAAGHTTCAGRCVMKTNLLAERMKSDFLKETTEFPSRKAGDTYLLGINNAILHVPQIPNGMTLISALSLCKQLNLEMLKAASERLAL